MCGPSAVLRITKAVRPHVRLVSCVPEETPRGLGARQGRKRIADDFDESPEDVTTYPVKSMRC